MSETEIMNHIEKYSEDGSFYFWAYQHVINAFHEWHTFMGEERPPCIMTYDDDVTGINYDAYWLYECRNSEELDALLNSWFQKEPTDIIFFDK